MTNQFTPEQIEALGPGFEVESFDQLWRAIGRLPFVSQDGPYAWRGVPDSSFRVQSSLYRSLKSKGPVDEESLRRAELKILQEARRWGLGRLDRSPISDLQLLSALQHAGVPTRLLDVTANPLTALWFAAASHPDADGLLLAFNLSEYVQLEAQDETANWGNLANPTGFALEAALVKSETSNAPFIVRPTFLDARMAAQEGFFIASACPPSPIDEYREVPRPGVDGMYLGPSGYIPIGAAESILFGDDDLIGGYFQSVWSFKIGQQLKAQIVPALESNFNRSAAVLFPDFAGFRDFRAGSRVWAP